jgi:hypothetical protein
VMPTSGIAGNGIPYLSSTPLRLRMAARQLFFLPRRRGWRSRPRGRSSRLRAGCR